LQEPQDQAVIPQKGILKKKRTKKPASKQKLSSKKAFSGGKSSIDDLLHSFNNCLGGATPSVNFDSLKSHTTCSIDAKGEGRILFASKFEHTRN
jgi:hypothetical protein